MSNEDQSLIACLEVAVVIARKQPDLLAFRIARTIHDLQRIGRQLHRRYEASCSYQWADSDAYRRRTEQLELKVAAVAVSGQVSVELQRDPRGWPIIIQVDGVELRIGGGR